MPVLAPEGTVAVTLPSFAKAKDAEVPLNRTALTPVKWFPLIVTDVPITPLEGENPLMAGTVLELTVKFAALVVVPDVVVSWIFPVVAPEGTVRHLSVRLEGERRGGSVEPHTLTPVKPLPVMMTEVPGGPVVGENPLITGFIGTRISGTGSHSRRTRSRRTTSRSSRRLARWR